ncbi:MAG: hypothetical protein ACJ77E_16630 [Gaiellaceae bacterium]
MKKARRAALGAVLVAACIAAALVSGVISHGAPAADAAGPCQLGGKNGQIKHVIYLQFDNTHFRRDVAGVPSDLEQMPHLLNFLKGNGTLLTNDHTILISHTAGGIVASLTGLYPDRNGQTVSNSYDYYQANGTPTFTSSFKYWNNTVAGANDPLPNMVSDGGQTTPAPWLTFTGAGCSVGGVSAANIELENNNAVRITGGPTPLLVAAAAGDTSIKVASVNGFSAGQTITVGNESATISNVGTAGAAGTGISLTTALTSAHASSTSVFGTVTTDPTGDVTSLFGEGSDAWNEARASQEALSGTAARTLAQTDLVGIAIHCAKGTSPCTNNPDARPDPATIYPGSDNGFTGLFGAKYVNPAIGGVNGCIKATDGTNITDQFGQCGFPGFDGALAKNTLGEVEAMQLHGVPVTFAYISDAHDNHVTASAMGPGEAAYQQQLKDYDAAFATWFQDLAAHGIDKSNTLFVVTVDEGDHFAGGTGSPDPANPGALTYTHAFCPQASVTAVTPCPTNQIGEVNVKIGSILPAGESSFDIHFDDAPTFYVNGQPNRNDTSVRQLERDVGAAKAPDPYANAVIPVTQRLADTVEEKTLHMVNADPKRTPTFTMFGNADFFFQTTNLAAGCNGAGVCVNPAFAWNHGDFQDEIANTWAGYVGPGVANNGVDSTTWTDHVDLRPTILQLVGLKDSYLDDGRVVSEILGKNHDQDDLRRVSNDKGKGGHDDDDAAGGRGVDPLGAAYKQINAPFGQFALDTLIASTNALEQPATQSGDLAYDTIESQIANLTVERDALAGAIRAALNSGDKIDEDQARDWIRQAQSLLDRSHALAAANPA